MCVTVCDFDVTSISPLFSLYMGCAVHAKFISTLGLQLTNIFSSGEIGSCSIAVEIPGFKQSSSSG